MVEDVAVKSCTFAISSPDEFLVLTGVQRCRSRMYPQQIITKHVYGSELRNENGKGDEAENEGKEGEKALARGLALMFNVAAYITDSH